MIYVTSDWHFNHDREFIWKARGFNSVEEMNETIIERFNEIVKPNDDVYVLGDLCLGGGNPENVVGNQKSIERMNGYLHVILGNHDTTSRIQMYQSCKNIASIDYATMLKYNGYYFYMSHYPTLTGNLEKENLKQMALNLFGHTHQTTNFYNDMPFMFHCGVDSHNCYPIGLDRIIYEMKNKVNECINEL